MAKCGAKEEGEEVRGQLRGGWDVMEDKSHRVQKGDKGLTLASLECELEALALS